MMPRRCAASQNQNYDVAAARRGDGTRIAGGRPSPIVGPGPAVSIFFGLAEKAAGRELECSRVRLRRLQVGDAAGGRGGNHGQPEAR